MWAPTPDALLLTSWGLALVSALAGSLHCTVMCGPLRLLVEKAWPYQIGRLLGYLFVGAVFGTIGWHFPWWAWVPLYLLLVSTSLFSFSWWRGLHQKVLRVARIHPMALGISTAFFPCGLLYAWVGVAALAKDPFYGAIFLGILWLGSLPSLEFAPILLKKVKPWRSQYPKIFTVILILLAATPLLLRARPHVHPAPVNSATENAPAHSCH